MQKSKEQQSLWRTMERILSPAVSAGRHHTLLLTSPACRKPFAAARRPSTRYQGNCRADSNHADGKQSVKDQLGQDVLRKLREAEEEAASLREQLAEAKAKAEVPICMHTKQGVPPARICYVRHSACLFTPHACLRH